MPSPTPEVGSSNISFSGLRESWGTESYVGGSDPGSGSNSNISLSEFRGATFTNDTSVPDDSDEEISIEDDFQGRTFGSAAVASYEFAINVGGTYAISGSLSSISPSSSGYAFTTQQSTTTGWQAYSMGARINFLTAGTVVAIRAQNWYGGDMALYPDDSDTAVATATVVGTSSSGTARNYKYTTLTSPVSVSANSYYRLAFKNSSGGYAYHNISAYDGTDTASGNMRLMSGMYKYVGNSGSIATNCNAVSAENGRNQIIRLVESGPLMIKMISATTTVTSA